MISQAMAQRIEYWPIDKLVFYARNPRKNDAVVDRMCSSIREFGFKIPCLVRNDGEVLDGQLGERKPRLMVTDPPYGIELDSEWRDRAGLNGCGPAEPSYLKKRTAGHTETTIFGDTRAHWLDAFALVPSLEPYRKGPDPGRCGPGGPSWPCFNAAAGMKGGA